MTERFILESFWQKAANCVCIALIKAALLKYGMRSMFYCRRINDHYLVTLRDGTMLVLNDTEIDRINGTNKLMFRRYAEAQQKKWLKRLKAHVHLSFAIMVRQIQLKGFDGMEYTESEAKKLLTAEGMETDHALKLLGLTRKTKTAHLFKRKTPAALMKKNRLSCIAIRILQQYPMVISITMERRLHWFPIRPHYAAERPITGMN